MKEVWGAVSAAGDAVLGTAVLIAVGAWGGLWLDGKLHTTSWLAIVLSLVGMVLGLTRMILKTLKSEKTEK
jgi:F0F1-type ATP synthase assembly protein I